MPAPEDEPTTSDAAPAPEAEPTRSHNDPPPRPARDPRRWIFLIFGALPILVAFGWLTLKPSPPRIKRVRPPGPTIPLDAGLDETDTPSVEPLAPQAPNR